MCVIAFDIHHHEAALRHAPVVNTALKQHEVGWQCPACMLTRPESGVDPCLGTLPGVKYACCGHGGMCGGKDGYIYFENGWVVRFDYLTEFYNHKDGGGRRWSAYGKRA